jgi:hypothetical protein
VDGCGGRAVKQLLDCGKVRRRIIVLSAAFYAPARYRQRGTGAVLLSVSIWMEGSRENWQLSGRRMKTSH